MSSLKAPLVASSARAARGASSAPTAPLIAARRVTSARGVKARDGTSRRPIMERARRAEKVLRSSYTLAV
eukprot:7390659-Prymnesium_polylepis.1